MAFQLHENNEIDTLSPKKTLPVSTDVLDDLGHIPIDHTSIMEKRAGERETKGLVSIQVPSSSSFMSSDFVSSVLLLSSDTASIQGHFAHEPQPTRPSDHCHSMFVRTNCLVLNHPLHSNRMLVSGCQIFPFLIHFHEYIHVCARVTNVN